MPDSAVTPAGVRDGEPEALRGLVARRGPAVLAYCAAVCEPPVAPRAVAEAFARFRGAVAAAVEPGALAPEPLLLGATRHAAASMARTAPPTGAGLRRILGDRGANETCAVVPTLLAAQADGMLSPADQEKLRRHLDRHPACRTVEAGFRAAEARYAEPPDRPIPPAVERLVLTALVAAAPLAPGVDASGILSTGRTEEEDAVAAAQETRDWAAADVAAAVAADDAAIPTAIPEPLADDQPLDAGEPEQPSTVASAVVEEERTATEERRAAEHRAAAAEAAEVIAGEDDEDDDADVLDEPAPHPDAVTVAVTVPDEDEPATAVHEVVPVPPTRSFRERLHLPDEQDHGPFFRFVLPGAAIVVALLIAMLIAGVFGSGDDARPAGARPASQTTAAAPATAAVAPSDVAAPAEPAEPSMPKAKRAKRKARRPTAATTPAAAATADPTPTPAVTPSAGAATPASRPRTSTPRTARNRSTKDAERSGASPSLPGAQPQTTSTAPADEPVFTPGEATP